jgi:hypothetical protein
MHTAPKAVLLDLGEAVDAVTPFKSSNISSERDCFSQKLPSEICLNIAECLSIKDVVNLRLASRGFWHVFRHQRFWATRFANGHERSWLYDLGQYVSKDDLTTESTHFRDWMSLFVITNESRIDAGLFNRIRIWNLIPNILNLVGLAREYQMSNVWTRDDFRPEEVLGNRRTVAGRLLPDIHYDNCGDENTAFFNRECLHLRSQTVEIGRSMTRVIVYFVCSGEITYICGLRLESTTCHGDTAYDSSEGDGVEEDGTERYSTQEVMVGFWSPMYAGVDDVNDLYSPFKGFITAVGPQGIHALQVVGAGGAVSAWLGDPAGCPITQRLVFNTHQITHIAAGFDVSADPGIFSSFRILRQ